MDIIGSSNSDTLSGTEAEDRIDGLAGNDYLTGEGGDDTIDAGNGADHLIGGAGNDILYGGHDTDYLDGGEGDDVARGGSGDDYLVGALGRDTLIGGAGNDTYYLSGKASIAEYENQGYDIVYVTDTAYTAVGEIEEIYFSGDKPVSIRGSDSDNIITANGAPGIHLYGGGGNDVIQSWAQSFINGGEGNDSLYSTWGDDEIRGGGGNDYIFSGTGNDTISGGGGADTFVIVNWNFDASITVADFNGDQDGIELRSFFELGSSGPLDATNFHAGEGETAVAQDGNDYVIFDAGNGALYYDSDGNGTASQIQIATLNVVKGSFGHEDILIA